MTWVIGDCAGVMGEGIVNEDPGRVPAGTLVLEGVFVTTALSKSVPATIVGRKPEGGS